MEKLVADASVPGAWTGEPLTPQWPASRAAIDADIRRYSSACGCELGALFMVGAALSFSAYATLTTTGWSTAETCWRGGIWVLSLSVVGKLLGLGYARVRLRMLRAEQRRALSSESRPFAIE